MWQALQSHPNYALIDSSALPYRPDSVINSPVYDPNAPLPADVGMPTQPPGFNTPYTFSLSGVYQGDTTFPATPVWVTGLQAPGDDRSITPSVATSAIKLTIIGVVDNSDSAHYGLYIPRGAYSGGNEIKPTTPNAQTYYFKVAPGQDKRALSLALGSAFLDNGLETTVLEDAIWQLRGPRIFLSNVLLGVVGLTLLLGVTALAITGTRAVIERRQQIGLLRAIGCGRGLIQVAFLCEFLRAIQYGSYLQRSMGRTVPDRWDCSSGLVPGCAAAGMAGGEDFACRGDTVPVAHQFQGEARVAPIGVNFSPSSRATARDRPYYITNRLAKPVYSRGDPLRSPLPLS